MGSPTVTVFGSSIGAPGDPEYDQAQELGRLLGAAGYTVATGGYGGSMEAVSAGAHEAGGSITGVTAPDVFPHRDVPNRFVQEHVRAASLTERIHELVDIADACIALPGSIGTFTELMVAWNLAFVARFSESPAHPVVAVGAVWKRLIDDLADELATDPSLVTCVDSPAEAVAVLQERLGAP